MIGAVNIQFELGNYLNQIQNLIPGNIIYRAEKYHFEEDKKRCLAGELLKHALLSERLNIHPAKLKFQTNEYDKPELKNTNALHFNLTHSGNWVVMIIDTKPVGIDIELIQSNIPDVEKIVFTDQEIRQIHQTDSTKKIERFFYQWTRKESYIKALGLGFSAPLEKITILESLSGDIRIESEQTDADWQIQDIKFDPDYCLSVCSKNQIPAKVRLYEFDDLLKKFT